MNKTFTAQQEKFDSQGVRCGAGSGLDILLVDPEDNLAIQFKTSIDSSILVVNKRV
jgi:hypothetical protein